MNVLVLDVIIVIVIILAVDHRKLDIGIPFRPPVVSIGRGFHPLRTHGLHPICRLGFPIGTLRGNQVAVLVVLTIRFSCLRGFDSSGGSLGGDKETACSLDSSRCGWQRTVRFSKLPPWIWLPWWLPWWRQSDCFVAFTQNNEGDNAPLNFHVSLSITANINLE